MLLIDWLIDWLIGGQGAKDFLDVKFVFRWNCLSSTVSESNYLMKLSIESYIKVGTLLINVAAGIFWWLLKEALSLYDN